MGENEKIEQASADGSRGEQETSRGRSEITTIGLAVIVVAAVVIYAVVSPVTTKRALERRAAAILRIIGLAELAFQGTNSDRLYGSFEDLKLTRYISQDETAGSMIEGYTLVWSIENHVERLSDFGTDGLANSFTIVAYPRSERIHLLRTFAVTESQIVRVYNPADGNKPDAVNGWDRAP